MTTSINGVSGVQGTPPATVELNRSVERSPASDSGPASPSGAEIRIDAISVAEATRQVEHLFQTVRRNLQFKDDPTSGRLVVSVIDAESGEIIRQIPPERMLRMAENLEQITGLLLGERV